MNNISKEIYIFFFHSKKKTNGINGVSLTITLKEAILMPKVRSIHPTLSSNRKSMLRMHHPRVDKFNNVKLEKKIAQLFDNE